MNGCKESIALINTMLEKSSRRNATVSTFTRDRIVSDLFGSGSTLFTRDWFETRTVRFHLRSLHKWTHLVPDSRFDTYWIHQVPFKHMAYLYQFHTSSKQICYFVNAA